MLMQRPYGLAVSSWRSSLAELETAAIIS